MKPLITTTMTANTTMTMVTMVSTRVIAMMKKKKTKRTPAALGGNSKSTSNRKALASPRAQAEMTFVAASCRRGCGLCPPELSRRYTKMCAALGCGGA